MAGTHINRITVNQIRALPRNRGNATSAQRDAFKAALPIPHPLGEKAARTTSGNTSRASMHTGDRRR